ncbi:unnamed protein product [Phaedon cochleariae]|uniref:Uncharacterized protein n=1 Tax=Phaedon cochleariae TaxID=80249 RepID=A0A9P0DLV7_PHACE|nr:unnamed protein product [Phaedon cochleariae]
MNKFVLICIFVTLVSARPAEKKWEAKLHKIHDECQLTAPTRSPEEVTLTLDIARVKALSLCINVKSGIQNEQGDIDRAALGSLLGQDPQAEEIVKQCGDRKGDTPPDAAYRLFQCLVDYMSVSQPK